MTGRYPAHEEYGNSVFKGEQISMVSDMPRVLKSHANLVAEREVEEARQLELLIFFRSGWLHWLVNGPSLHEGFACTAFLQHMSIQTVRQFECHGTEKQRSFHVILIISI